MKLKYFLCLIMFYSAQNLLGAESFLKKVQNKVADIKARIVKKYDDVVESIAIKHDNQALGLTKDALTLAEEQFNRSRLFAWLCRENEERKMFVVQTNKKLIELKRKTLGAEPYQKASDTVTTWVNEELKGLGYKGKEVVVLKNKKYSFAAVGSATMFIEDYNCAAIERYILLLRTMNKKSLTESEKDKVYAAFSEEDQEGKKFVSRMLNSKSESDRRFYRDIFIEPLFNEIHCTLAHEGEHIAQRHSAKEVLFSSGLPPIAIAANMMLKKTMPRIPFFLRWGFIANACHLAKRSFRIQKEWDADEAIPDEKALLNQTYEHYKEGDDWFCSLPLWKQLELKYIDSHPSYAARANRFKERLEALQKKK